MQGNVRYVTLVCAAAAAALAAGTAAGKGNAGAAAQAEVRRQELIRQALASVPPDDGKDETLAPYFFVLSDDPETDRLPLEGTKDFVLRYRLAGDDIGSGVLLSPGKKGGWFLAMVEPPAKTPPAKLLPREYLFILDVSGSMSGYPLEVSRKLAGDILSTLGPDDYVNVLLFAGGSAVLSPASLPATPANVAAARSFIESQGGGGGTELLPALKKALALPRPDGVSRIVVLATDGYVDVEKEAFELVRKSLGEANLFAFGIGTSVNRFLVEGLARAGMGEPFVVLDKEQAAGKAARFVEYVSSPLLRAVEVTMEGFDACDVEPPSAPDLFAARPVVVFGRYKGKPAGSIVVKGRGPGGPFERRIDVAQAAADKGNVALKYLWARHRIMRLADLQKLDESDARAAQVTKLGLAYGLMTDYTSFVAVDTLVRADGKKVVTVTQPLPLPEGVTDKAVGGKGKGGGGGSGWGYGMGSGGFAAKGAGAGIGLYSLSSSAGSAPATVAGSYSTAGIAAVVKKNLTQVRGCYEAALAKNPKLAGKVVVAFTIGADGKVTKASIKESTLGSKEVEESILKVVKGWVFPAPADGAAVNVSYPFVFTP